jgi:chemotaxis receptor (MCP) glutamine deamidase CheD
MLVSVCILQGLKNYLVESVGSLGHQMLTTLSNTINIFVFRYARTAIRVLIMEFMGKSAFGQL